jgi:NDP-sugar pyrophosphorylase family protein
MFNILYPIAGFGTRFANQGFKELKPFIKIKDKYIIEYSLSSLNISGNYYIITRQLDKKYKDILNEIFHKYNINGHIIEIDRPTLGAAETCYLIKDYINNDNPLLVTNCDQYTPWDSNKFIEFINHNNYDVVVTTFNHEPITLNTLTKYSFIKVNNSNLATEFSEKLAISYLSLNGIHYWRKSSLFFDSAKLLLEDKSIIQEKYISLTFNYLIKQNYRISYFNMEPNTFYSLGSPEEIEKNLDWL